MLDWLNAVAGMFGSFVSMLFTLPFYGSVSYGHVLLGVYIIGVILVYLGSRYRD